MKLSTLLWQAASLLLLVDVTADRHSSLRSSNDEAAAETVVAAFNQDRSNQVDKINDLNIWWKAKETTEDKKKNKKAQKEGKETKAKDDGDKKGQEDSLNWIDKILDNIPTFGDTGEKGSQKGKEVKPKEKKEKDDENKSAGKKEREEDSQSWNDKILDAIQRFGGAEENESNAKKKTEKEDKKAGDGKKGQEDEQNWKDKITDTIQTIGDEVQTWPDQVQNFWSNIDWNEVLEWLRHPCQRLEDQFDDQVTCAVDLAMPLILDRQIKFILRTSGEQCIAADDGHDWVCGVPGYTAAIDFDDHLVSSGFFLDKLRVDRVLFGDFELSAAFRINPRDRTRGLGTVLGVDKLIEILAKESEQNPAQTDSPPRNNSVGDFIDAVAEEAERNPTSPSQPNENEDFTEQQTDEPSSAPSINPSAVPSFVPSEVPSAKPSAIPSEVPSSKPSRAPSAVPSRAPSAVPSKAPSAVPSMAPSSKPSQQPSSRPSSAPSSKPSSAPSAVPSRAPSSQPSQKPSSQPSSAPSSMPVGEPSAAPSNSPSALPSSKPSSAPSAVPSRAPSSQPSQKPSFRPSSAPSSMPVGEPSAAPSNSPSAVPSKAPSSQPSAMPMTVPSTSPSSAPSPRPSSFPSARPSTSFAPSFEPSTSAAPTTIREKHIEFASCTVKIASVECNYCGPCESGGFAFDCSNIIPGLNTTHGDCSIIQIITNVTGASRSIAPGIPEVFQHLHRFLQFPLSLRENEAILVYNNTT